MLGGGVLGRAGERGTSYYQGPSASTLGGKILGQGGAGREHGEQGLMGTRALRGSVWGESTGGRESASGQVHFLQVT